MSLTQEQKEFWRKKLLEEPAKPAKPALTVIATAEVPSEILRKRAEALAIAAARRLDEELAALPLKHQIGHLENLLGNAKDPAERERLGRRLDAAQAQWADRVARAQSAIDWHGAQSNWHEIEQRRLETLKLGPYSF